MEAANSLRATRGLRCEICSTSDKNTNRMVVQCNAGDKDELGEIKNKHADMTQDACARALHVGCAHYRPMQAALSHRKVIGDNRKPQTFFFPGSQEGKYSEPVSAVYCIKHLGEIKMCHKKQVGFAELTEILKKEKKAEQETRKPEKTGYVYVDALGGRLSEDDGGKPKKNKKRKKEKEKEKGLEADPQKEVRRKKKQDASLLSTTTTTTTVAPPKTSPVSPPPRLSPSSPPTPQNPLPTEAAPKKAASPAVRKSSSKKATPTPDNVWGADGEVEL